jgi:hypothetical protein
MIFLNKEIWRGPFLCISMVHMMLRRRGWFLSMTLIFLLEIEDAQAGDTGRYTCEATNVAGKTEKNYNVNVWGEYNERLSHPAGSLGLVFLTASVVKMHPSTAVLTRKGSVSS